MSDTIILIILIIVIVIFLVGREIANWYLKINIRIKLQEETNELLKKLLNK